MSSLGLIWAGINTESSLYSEGFKFRIDSANTIKKNPIGILQVRPEKHLGKLTYPTTHSSQI